MQLPKQLAWLLEFNIFMPSVQLYLSHKYFTFLKFISYYQLSNFDNFKKVTLKSCSSWIRPCARRKQILWANLSNNGPLPANSTFTFTLQIQWPLAFKPCYILTFGNVYSEDAGQDCVQWGGSSDCSSVFPEPYLQKCTQSSLALNASFGYLYAQQKYSSIQTYWPVAYGRNQFSAIMNTSNFVVATCYGNCYAPTVDVKTPQTCVPGLNCDPVYNVLTNYRSVQLKLSSYMTSKCSCSLKYNFNWTFSYYNASSQHWNNFTEELRQLYISAYGNDSFFWSNFNAYNLRSIIVPNHTMPYGLYKVCLNISVVEISGSIYKFFM